MTISEFNNLAKMMQAYFTRGVPNFSDKFVMSMWYDELKDMDFMVAVTTLKKWTQTSDFCPSIAALRGTAVKVAHEDIGEWGDKYALVMKLVGSCGRDNKKVAYERMDPITQRTVERLGWRNICDSPVEHQAVDRANFRDIYNEEKAKLEKEAQTSHTVSNAVNLIREKNGNINLIQELEKREGRSFNLLGSSQEKPQIEEKSGKISDEEAFAYFAKAREGISKKKAQA